MQNPYLKNRKNDYLDNRTPSRTKQSFKEQTNIHNILNQYNKTGIIPPSSLNPKKPQYIDNTQIPPFEEMLNFTTQVSQHIEHHYDELPAKLKKRFKTPEALAEYLSDPENHEEAEKLGLINQAQEGVEGQPTKPTVTPSAPQTQSNELTNKTQNETQTNIQE